MHTHVTQNTSENLDLPVPVLTQSVSNPRNESMKIASANLRPALAPLLVPELDESKYEVIARAAASWPLNSRNLKKSPFVLSNWPTQRPSKPNALRSCNARTFTRWKKR